MHSPGVNDFNFCRFTCFYGRFLHLYWQFYYKILYAISISDTCTCLRSRKSISKTTTNDSKSRVSGLVSSSQRSLVLWRAIRKDIKKLVSLAVTLLLGAVAVLSRIVTSAVFASQLLQWNIKLLIFIN